MLDAESLKENPNKRRAVDSLKNRSEMDMETLKGFMIDQNVNLQATITKDLKEVIENNNKANLQSMEQIQT